MDQLTIPSKLYPAMAAGQAILALMGPGAEVGEMTLEHEMGIRVTQGDAEGMASQIESLIDNPAQVDEMKVRSRKALEEHYSRDISIQGYLDILEAASQK